MFLGHSALTPKLPYTLTEVLLSRVRVKKFPCINYRARRRTGDSFPARASVQRHTGLCKSNLTSRTNGGSRDGAPRGYKVRAEGLGRGAGRDNEFQKRLARGGYLAAGPRALISFGAGGAFNYFPLRR